MHKTLRGAALVGVGITTLMLTGCVGSEPPPEPEVLTVSQAGNAYLDAVCPVNAAWDQADAELEKLRLRLAQGAAKPDALAAALEEVAAESAAAAKRLDPSRTTWPGGAQDAVAEVRTTLVADRAQAQKLAALEAEEMAEYRWKGADDTAAAAESARASLDLPSDSDAACAQRAAQLAESQPQSKE